MQRKYLRLSALVVLTVMLLTACGGKPSTLEKYIEANPGEQEYLDKITGEVENATVEIKKNTMTVKYVIDNPDVKVAGLEAGLDFYENTFREIPEYIEEETGISGIIFKVVYVDAEDNEITSREFVSAGE